jgi:DNA-binding response OmpR family regulator
MVGASRKGKRILVVEDEHHFGNILYKLLRQYDHKVHRAGNAQEALDLLADNEFDAVSLDFILPDKNGMEVYLKIRETNKQIPIVFVSGNFEFMQSMIDLKKKDPKVDHLAKPFNNVDYVNMIHKWLG